jgi:hypothetical protein
VDLTGLEIQLLMRPNGHFTVSFEGGELEYTKVTPNPPVRRHRRLVEARRPPATPRQRAWMQDFIAQAFYELDTGL